MAALSKEFRGVLTDIAKLPDTEEEDPLDRVESAIADALNKVRADRKPDPEAPARP